MGDGEYSSAEDDIANVNRVEGILGERQLKLLLGKQKHRTIIKTKRVGLKKLKPIKWSSI